MSPIADDGWCPVYRMEVGSHQGLRGQEPYLRSGGRDHFIALGWITWDFRRSRDDDWGGSFLYMPGMEKTLAEHHPFPNTTK